jgi:tRNA dimethylallyltransferase
VPSSDRNAPIFLAGPSAVGKSEIALRLAERLGGEIISVDSMQVYRGLDIGTAKPTAAERARVPHHLIDVVDLAESFDASKFVTLANAAVKDIQARGRIPIFCGGTGLYFKAFREGLGEGPPSDAALRAELEAAPLEALLAELRERDPVTFAKIDQKNPRRVIRAVEVTRLTGRPFSDQRALWNSKPVTRNLELLFGLSRAAADLHHRIDARVSDMFRRGLVEETRRLLDCGLEQNRTAMQAIGYRQVVEHLRGERPLAATVELVKIRTRQFVKRQLTWLKRHAAPAWIALSPEEPASAVLERLATAIANTHR